MNITAKYIAYLWIFWKISKPASPSYLLPELKILILLLVISETFEGIPFIGVTAQAGGFSENAL